MFIPTQIVLMQFALLLVLFEGWVQKSHLRTLIESKDYFYIVRWRPPDPDKTLSIHSRYCCFIRTRDQSTFKSFYYVLEYRKENVVWRKYWYFHVLEVVNFFGRIQKISDHSFPMLIKNNQQSIIYSENLRKTLWIQLVRSVLRKRKEVAS